jgi:hypothetical protein
MALNRKPKPKPKTIKLVRVGRKLEGSFSVSMRKQLAKMGLMSYKVSDRFRAGIPDTYMPSGIWIEAKIIPTMPTKLVPPIRYFSGAQRLELNRLTKHGDQCFAALYFAFDHYSAAFALVPWEDFLKIASWDLDTISTLGTIIDKRNEDFKLERFFSKDAPLKYDPKIWWNEAFDDWIRKHPEKYDHTQRGGHIARLRAAYDRNEDGEVEWENAEDNEPSDSREEDSPDRL